MIPAMRLTCLRSESSKRSTGVALDFRTGSPSSRMKDIAATRRASASGSSCGASSSVAPRSRPRVLSPLLGHRAPSLTPSGATVLLRIHVDREARRARARARAATVLHRVAHGGDRRRSLARADHELRAVAALAAEQRRRAEHGHARGRDELADRRRPPPAPGRAPPTSTPPGSGGRAAGSRAARAGRARPRGSPPRRAARRSAAPRPTGPAPARSRARRARRARCARRAAPPARRCAPRRGSRGSAAWRRRPAPPRASRRGSRGPWPPSACPRARPAGASSKRRSTVADAGRPPRRRSRAGTPAAAPPAPRARARAARCPRRGAPPTPSRSRGTPAAPARGGRSGGRPPRRAPRWSTSVTSQFGHSHTRAQRAAREEVRPAAPVQQHDRLLPAAPHLVERLARALVERPGRAGHRRPAPPAAAGARPRAPAARSARSAAMLSGRGVALPATSSAPSSAARRSATARAS